MPTQPAQLAADDQQERPYFVCGTCGEPVVVYGGNSFRTCPHLTDPIVATERGLKEATSGVR
jgi:hypothetical protein